MCNSVDFNEGINFVCVCFRFPKYSSFLSERVFEKGVERIGKINNTQCNTVMNI